MRPFKHICIVALASLLSLAAAAQGKLSFSLRKDNVMHAKTGSFARIIAPRPADNLLYGFPPVITEAQRRSSARARYQRYLLNNKNGNGFIGNLLGIQRVRPSRGEAPRF